MDEVVSFSMHTVVACVRGRSFGMPFLKSWARRQWGVNIAEPPTICTLVNGWFSFTFSSKDNAIWVISKQWEMVHIPLMMKRWSPIVDAQREFIDKELIWV